MPYPKSRQRIIGIHDARVVDGAVLNPLRVLQARNDGTRPDDTMVKMPGIMGLAGAVGGGGRRGAVGGLTIINSDLLLQRSSS